MLDSFALDFSFAAPELTGKGAVGAVIVGLLGGGVFAVRPLLGIAAVVGICGCLVVIYRPFAGVVFSVMLAPFIPTMLLAGLVMLTLCSLLLYSMTPTEFKWRLDWVGAAVTGFLLVTWLSVISSYARKNSLMVAAITTVFVLFYFCHARGM